MNHSRHLGFRDVFSIAAGAMISSGLFVLPGLAYAKAGPAVILAYCGEYDKARVEMATIESYAGELPIDYQIGFAKQRQLIEDIAAGLVQLAPLPPPPELAPNNGKQRPFKKIGRNVPCPCGSGKKYKKCCLRQQTH